MHGAALVGWGFAGGDEELHLVWIGGHFDVRESLGPGRGADQPHEGEDDRHHEVLEKKNRGGPREGGNGGAVVTQEETALTTSGPRLFSRYLFWRKT